MKRLVKLALLTSLAIVPTSTMTADTTYATNSSILDENPSIELGDKTYYDTGYVATVRGLVDDFDGKLNNFNNKSDVRYKKGIDPNTIIVEKDFYTQIFATKDFAEDKIPDEVYRANYIVTAYDQEKNLILLKYLQGGGDTAEALKDAVYMASAKYFKDNPVKVGDKVKLWHWFPTNGDKELMIPEVYKIEHLEKEESEDTKPQNRPLENIPPEASKQIFVVKEIRKDNSTAILYKEGNKDMEYILDLDQFRDNDVKVNDNYKIYWDGKVLESYPAQFGHIYRVDKLEKDENEKKRKLAISTYDNLVYTKAATILLEQSPKTVANIKAALEAELENSKKLVDKANKAFLNEEDEDQAIIRIIQYKYDKKLETEKEQKLAISSFENMVMSHAGKLLLEQTPETIKDIEDELKVEVEKSEALVEKALNALK